MPRLFLLNLLFLCGLALSGQAQPLIRAYPAVEPMLEGGNADILVMDTLDQSYAVNQPKNFGAQIRLDSERIVFTSVSNLSVMTIEWTTNHPGLLPKPAVLEEEAKARFPGATIMQPFRCVTGMGLGSGFDLVEIIPPGKTLRVRDAFLALPNGMVEFTFSCNGPDFDEQNRMFLRLINSFRLHPVNAIKKR